MEIQTPRLRIRRAQPADLEPLHAILSDARAMRYWSTLPHPDLAATRAWLDDMLSAPLDESDDFVIERCGAVIGKAGCWKLPEIGYIIHPDHWGQGLALEALGAIVTHIFAAHEISAITAEVDPRNEASLRVLARLGFEETGRAQGTYEIAGEISDSVYLALRRPTDR